MLYIGDKCVNVAACPAEGGPAEAGGLSTSNLPLVPIPHPARMPDGQAKAREVCMYVCTCVCMYVCMYVYTYICRNLFLYVCMYICMYIYMRMYVCMYVHTWENKFSRGENPKRHLPGRSTFPLRISNSYDATYLHVKEVLWFLRINKITKKRTNQSMYMDDIKQIAKNEKELKTLIQTIRIWEWNMAKKCVPCS